MKNIIIPSTTVCASALAVSAGNTSRIAPRPARFWRGAVKSQFPAVCGVALAMLTLAGLAARAQSVPVEFGTPPERAGVTAPLRLAGVIDPGHRPPRRCKPAWRFAVSPRLPVCPQTSRGPKKWRGGATSAVAFPPRQRDCPARAVRKELHVPPKVNGRRPGTGLDLPRKA